jgi:DNA gyrase/topoisomerase IV subunit B
MADKTAGRITVLEGVAAVRLRPELYIGAQDEPPSQRARLLELAVTEIAWEWRPQEIRILLWREDAVTIAYDGRPLPIEPSRPVDDVPYPALYPSFMHLLVPSLNGIAALNALSEQLVVSTMHDSRRYRGVFSKGMIASLLCHRHYLHLPLGDTWLTYRPDATIVVGEALTPDGLHDIAERVELNLHRIAERFGPNAEGVRIRVEDRMTEDADWD